MKIPTIFIVFLLFLISCSNGGPKESFGYLDVYYTESVSNSEVLDLGDYLMGIGFGLSEDRKEVVRLSKDNNGRYLIEFVMRDGKVSLESSWRLTGDGISQKVFNGAPVDVNLCDSNFNTLKFLPAER